jgi:hypothetical protein
MGLIRLKTILKEVPPKSFSAGQSALREESSPTGFHHGKRGATLNISVVDNLFGVVVKFFY